MISMQSIYNKQVPLNVANFSLLVTIITSMVNVDFEFFLQKNKLFYKNVEFISGQYFP